MCTMVLGAEETFRISRERLDIRICVYITFIKDLEADRGLFKERNNTLDRLWSLVG